MTTTQNIAREQAHTYTYKYTKTYTYTHTHKYTPIAITP